jgi:hypothetical protein
MFIKQCKRCKQEKTDSEFYVRKDNGKLTGTCKMCRTEMSSAYYAQNVERHKETVSRRYNSHGRFNRYGIDQEKYRSMLAKQGGVCALCGALEPGGKGKWHIDHEHTGVDPKHVFKQCEEEHVRGLLCHKCNISLGHYEKLKDAVGEEKILKYLGLEHLLE